MRRLKRAGLSTCAFEVRAPDGERVALFDHPMLAYRQAQDYRRMVRRLIGARVELWAVTR